MFASVGVSLVLTSAVVGALKTALILRYLLEPASATVPVIAAIMLVATALTLAVLTFIVHLFTPTRRRPVAVGAAGSPCKERIVAGYATQWGLSEAETDVALFVAKGFSNAEIAEFRGCAVATVKAQLGSLFRKSGLENRVQLISLVSDEFCDQAMDLAKTTPAKDALAGDRSAAWPGKLTQSAELARAVNAAPTMRPSERGH